MIDQIFKKFKEEDVNLVETGTSRVSGWAFPSRRSDPNELKDVTLDKSGKDQSETVVSRYFYKVYDDTPIIKAADAVSYPQFTVAYGNRKGLAGNFPTKAIYSQYVSSLLPKTEQSFGFEEDHFYAINFSKKVCRERIVPAAWQVSLKFSETGETLTLIDNSVQVPSTGQNEEIAVLSGTLSGGVENDKQYGFFYPKKGIIILNPNALIEYADEEKNIAPETRDPQSVLEGSSEYEYSGGEWVGGFQGNVEDARQRYPDFPHVRNHRKIFEAINRGSSIILEAEKQSLKSVFTVSASQDEFNHSLNPTYSGSNGPDDGTYVTGFGLYNDDYQLLATAKLESPKRKTSSTELSFDIEIDF